MKQAITESIKATKKDALELRLLLLSVFLLTTAGTVTTAQAQIPVILDDVGNSQWAAKCGQTGGYDACENLADQNLKGIGIPASPHMTAYYLLQACKYGNYEMCEFAYDMAKSIRKNRHISRKWSAKVWKSAVKKGAPYHAHDLALGMMIINQDKAEDAFIRSCEFGHADTCETVMSSFLHGINDVRKDEKKAASAAKRACELGVSSGCNFVGHSFMEKEDFKTALTYYGPSCESSQDPQTCKGALTAAYYATSPKDASTTKYAKLACDAGDGWACFTYGYNTPPVVRDQPKTWDDLMRESQNYWSNWKPSYCSNYTKAGVTSKVECADY